MKISSKYGKLVSIIVLVVVVASLVVAVNLINPTPVEACRNQGCTCDFWKCHPDKWVGHCPDEHLDNLFSGANCYHVGDCGLLNALEGIEHFIQPPDPPVIHPPDFTFIVGSLLTEGIAARLNVSCPDIDYHVSGGHVTQIVNDALHSGNHITITNVTNLLRGWNNAGFHH
jgi:hypothetical protein